ncbi:TRAP transporter small permease [Flexibacterium corallicola]|uniref:TRAP transporter small permease n=1 Tax=Flexibacterium corallicola TaxID=3037259 RepID=UPI00286F3998|nr:TRAP transporter small permease [Pseudovibrio sp. M1P-2-3]
MLHFIEKQLLNTAVICVICLSIIMTLSVISRAVFNWSFPDAIVLVRELMVGAIVLPLALTTARREHVSVEFITKRFSPQVQAALGIFGLFIGLIALSPFVFAGWRELLQTWNSSSYFYGDLDLPKWPGRLLFFIGVLLCWIRLATLLISDTHKLFFSKSAPKL